LFAVDQHSRRKNVSRETKQNQHLRERERDGEKNQNKEFISFKARFRIAAEILKRETLRNDEKVQNVNI